jgi:hypothetical protein
MSDASQLLKGSTASNESFLEPQSHVVVESGGLAALSVVAAERALIWRQSEVLGMVRIIQLDEFHRAFIYLMLKLKTVLPRMILLRHVLL